MINKKACHIFTLQTRTHLTKTWSNASPSIKDDKDFWDSPKNSWFLKKSVLQRTKTLAPKMALRRILHRLANSPHLLSGKIYHWHNVFMANVQKQIQVNNQNEWSKSWKIQVVKNQVLSVNAVETISKKTCWSCQVNHSQSWHAKVQIYLDSRWWFPFCFWFVFPNPSRDASIRRAKIHFVLFRGPKQGYDGISTFSTWNCHSWFRTLGLQLTITSCFQGATCAVFWQHPVVAKPGFPNGDSLGKGIL